MLTYAVKKSKKAVYVCIAKNESCDFSADDHKAINAILGKGHWVISEGVYGLPVEFDVLTLAKYGISKDRKNGRAKQVLDYMKERGSLKSYK